MLTVYSVRRLDEFFNPILHLLFGARRRPAVEADDVYHGEALGQVRIEDAKPLCDRSADVMCDDMCAIKPPMRDEAFENRNLRGD